MATYAVTTDSIDSDLKVLEVKKRMGTFTAMKQFMTRQLKADGFTPEKVYRGADWHLSGDNPIWLLRQKLCRQFRKGTEKGIDEQRWVFLLDADKYIAYRDEIEALGKRN